MTAPRRVRASDVLRAIDERPDDYPSLVTRLGAGHWRVKDCVGGLSRRGLVGRHVAWPPASEYRVTCKGRAVLDARRAKEDRPMGDEWTTDDPPLLARMNDGREIPIRPCDCGECGNEFFVPALSGEWMPSYCPYCGIKYVRHTCGGEPADYRPKGDPG